MYDNNISIREPLTPPSNIFIGATICNQEEADRDIPKLLTTPAAKRFVSIEPMLGAIDLRMVTDYRAQIDWVICGGESGKNARPMHPDWVRSLRDQCADAGVPFLFKQWGEYAPNGYIDPETRTIIDGSEWMDKMGKKLAGRLLDGVEHNEFPQEAIEAAMETKGGE